MRCLILISLLFSVFSSAQVSCERTIEKFLTDTSFSRVKKAAETLNLSVSDFQKRLNQFGYTEEKFFKEVDQYQEGKKVKYWDYILNPRKLADSIRGRQITNSSFVSSFFIMAGLHTGAQAFVHISALGAQKLDLLSAQLVALLMTEIALTLSSAKHAAYLVANPQIKKSINRTYEALDFDEKSVYQRIRVDFKNLQMGVKDIAQKTVGKITPMAKVAFVTSLVPFSYLASTTSNSLSELVIATLINSGFHTAFISIWSNFRYELFYGKIFPAINNSYIANSKIAEQSLVTGLVAANMIVASYTYTYGNSIVWSFSKE